MSAISAPARSILSFQSLRLIARTSPSTLKRALSTLPNNQHIFIHDQPDASPKQYLLSYLPTAPPIASLAIGTTTQIPPTPETLTENPEFLKILHFVIKDHAVSDPNIQAQAQVYASQAGSALGSGGVFFPQHQQGNMKRRDRSSSIKRGGDGAGGASSQGGIGGAGRGGYIHVGDERNPPDYGRVAYPEDILGSLEIDGRGEFVDGNGRYQAANTYRMVTREGILGLSSFLREKLVDKLRHLDTQTRKDG